MFIFLILFIFTESIPYEYCEKFPIHFDLYNCTYDPMEFRRTPLHISKFCPNWGTWECTTFKCAWYNPDGFCGFGEIDYGDCCTFKEIHYFDMWFKPKSNGYPDWKIEFFNLDIKGFGNDICINNGEEHMFYDVFYSNVETFLSVVLKYNETCATDLILYANGSYILNVTGEDLDLFVKFFFSTIIREMLEFENEGYDEELYFTSAHTLIPTPQRIMELYEMGPRRSRDTEICVYLTLPNLDICQEQLYIQTQTIEIQLEQIYIFINNLTDCDNATQFLGENLLTCLNATKMMYNKLMECQSAVTTLMIISIILGALLLLLAILFLIWIVYRYLMKSPSIKIPTSTEPPPDVFF